MTEVEAQTTASLNDLAAAADSSTADTGLEYEDAGDAIDEGRSSSLSELEDGTDEVDMVSAASVLSKQLEADSEAETERLENTPHKPIKHTDSDLGRIPFVTSPSKLVNSTILEESAPDAQSDSGVSSPGPSEDDDLESEMRSVHSAVSRNGNDQIVQSRESSLKKRKHDDIEEESGTEDDDDENRRRRRRTESVISNADDQSELGMSREPTVEPLEELPNERDILEGASSILRTTQGATSMKPSKGKSTKTKSRETLNNIAEEDEDPVGGADAGPAETRPASEDEGRAEAEDEEVDAEVDADAATKDEAELAKKMAAMDSLASLERHFALLRDRLYDERISALNEEIARLSAPKPTHPEYLRQLACIQKYRDDKFDFEQKLLVFKVQSLKTKSVAQRSQTHSAFYQTIRDVRERHLDEIGERMSRVRRDHINGDEKISSYSIPFPTKRSTQVTHQTAINKEVSVLSGIAKYVGFPAAPTVSSAGQHELDEDLGKMGISAHPVRNRNASQPRLGRENFSTAISRPAAEEQFREQNAWANPQHPAHLQHIGRLSRQVSDAAPVTDNTITPAQQRSAMDQMKVAGSASTIPEQLSAQPSSVLSAAYADPEVIRPIANLESSTGTHERPAPIEKSQSQRLRLQSLSPTESRKHNLFAHHDLGKGSAYASAPIDETVEGAIEQLRATRNSLFTTHARPDMPTANGNPAIETGGNRVDSSPITLHQRASEGALTPLAGLSQIGAR